MEVTALAFYFIVGWTLLSALGVVLARDIVRAAGYLIISLIGVAAAFALFGSLFVAMIQILVYAGAVIVLFLFGVMLTRREGPINRVKQLATTENLVYLVFSIFLFGLIASSALNFTGFGLNNLGFAESSLIGVSLFVQLKGAIYALAGLTATTGIGSIYVIKKSRQSGGKH